MIIWLNGTFGAGKTTTANALEASWPNSRQFDPEWVGFALARNLADQSFTNFQDLSPWRPLVVEMMDQIIQLTQQNVIAVQTVLNPDYWSEVRDGLEGRGHRLFHVVLDCDESILRKRIENDEVESGARDWRMGHLAEYASRKPWMVEAADLVVPTDGLTPEQTADLIVRAVQSAGA